MWQLLLLGASICSKVVLIDSIVGVDELNTSNGIDVDEKHVYATEHGPVRGYENNGVLQVFDIPYGAFTSERPFQVLFFLNLIIYKSLFLLLI